MELNFNAIHYATKDNFDKNVVLCAKMAGSLVEVPHTPLVWFTTERRDIKYVNCRDCLEWLHA